MVDRESLRRGYDELAADYAAHRSPGERERETIEHFCRAILPGGRVLGAGCGEGSPVLRRLSEPTSIVGLDIAREQLRRASETVPSGEHVQGTLTHLPVAADSVDAITALHSIIHVPGEHHKTIIDEFARVLRPGGRLLLSEGPREWEGTNPDWLDGGAEMAWHIADPETTREQLRTAGLVISEERIAGDELADDDSAWVFFIAEYDG